MVKYLENAIEMHLHTAPDVGVRKCSDLELAKRVITSGMGGSVVKCHYNDTAARAALLNEQFGDKGVRFWGGVVLNNWCGGVNPAAVEASGKMGGKLVWFATMDARSYQAFHKKPDLDGLVYVLDENGELCEAGRKVLEVAKKYNMIVGTGHLGAKEGLAIARAGKEIGVQIVITHADNPATFYTVEEQKEAIALGAVIEHSYFTVFYDRTPIEVMAEQIRAVGVENVFLDTDFGQVKSPYTDEGLEEFAEKLRALGFTEAELRMMFVDNPRKLLGL